MICRVNSKSSSGDAAALRLLLWLMNARLDDDNDDGGAMKAVDVLAKNARSKTRLLQLVMMMDLILL